MGLFDFLKRGAIPPSKPKGQPTVKVQASGKRMFDAAKSGRLEGNWSAFPTTPDAIVYQEWIKIVARSREQCQNNDHARKFVQMVRDNVAGPNGFMLNGQVKDPNGKADIVASKAIENAYEQWSKKGNFDTSGSLSRVDAERLAAGTWSQDGEFIFVIRYGEQAGPYGFAVQPMDAMFLHPMHFEKLPNGNQIRHGIEFNKYNRPVNYWFKIQDELQIGYTIGFGQHYEVIPAENVIHCFVPELVGQKRGLPQTRTALWRMKMLQGYEDAAVTNARVSYNNLSSDLTDVNFSSIRQGALDEREVWKGVQQWMINAFCIPLYEKWLQYALLTDKITINGKPLKLERLEKYKGVEFQGRRWAWIDPSADVAAAEKLLALKLRSRTSIMQEMGQDAEDTWATISREQDEMDKLGVVPEATAGSPTAPRQPEPKPPAK